MQDAEKSTLIVVGVYMSGQRDYKRGKEWKELEQDIMSPVADPLTEAYEYLTTSDDDTLEQALKKAEEEEYYENIKKRRKARLEALKEKYRD